MRNSSSFAPVAKDATGGSGGSRRLAALAFALVATAAACAIAPAGATPSPAPLVDAASPVAGQALPAGEARRQSALARLNAARLAAGAGPVSSSAALDAAAAGHSAYLSTHGFETVPSIHDERPGLGDSLGADPFARIRSAGYRYAYASEVIGEIGSGSPDADCVGDLLNTVYHASLLLGQVAEVGIGFGAGDAAGLCTIDLATPLKNGAAAAPASGRVIAYPSAGQRLASGVFNVDREIPRPSSALLPKSAVGTPVLVGLRNRDWPRTGGARNVVTLGRFELTDAHGAIVPAVILANASIAGERVNEDAHLGAGFAALVPTAPLPAGRYTVHLQAAVADGRELAATSWSFEVAPAS